MAAQSGTYPNRLRDLRMQNGLSQSAAAKAAGISQGAWSQYEIGKVEMRAATRAKICEALGCTPGEIYAAPEADTATRTMIVGDDAMDPVVMRGDVVYYTPVAAADHDIYMGLVYVLTDTVTGRHTLRMAVSDVDGDVFFTSFGAGAAPIPYQAVVAGRYTITGIARSLMRALPKFTT